MTIQLKNYDNKKIDALIESVLLAHKSDEVTLDQARYLIGHLISGAAADNAALLQEWMDPSRIARWKEECSKARNG